MSAVSLFSGCGGLDLGAESASIKTIYAIDSSEIAAKTLSDNFIETDVVHSNIESIKVFPKADILIGGYPCQSFSMGGRRAPATDKRSDLYLQYAKGLNDIDPFFFVAENVPGLKSVNGGHYLKEQIATFSACGAHGFNVEWAVLNSASFGVPQKRKRLFIVGVRKDLSKKFVFPMPTHGEEGHLLDFVSHGKVIKDLPLWPSGEFYHHPKDEPFSWYYMSRNRKASWDQPGYTIVANWRHTPLHPSGPIMVKEWSDLKNGFKQGWAFTELYDDSLMHSKSAVLETPRRLSWHECARIQTFPDSFNFLGNTMQRIQQIGNAVPPLLAKSIFEHLVSGDGLVSV